ncbi:MAG: sulfotransferase [Flavobacteriales bacterium]|nr:sulfotransferase [Flavobacteriales bacterium]
MSGLFHLAKRLAEPLRPRLLPSIVIVGAQKAGTSALYSMLVRHPRVIAPVEKELTFFGNDNTYALGMAHYRRMLPVRPLRGRGWTTLDATPNYLYRPAAAERIHRHLPGAVIVAVLRDPVKRARSDWNMFHQFKGHPRYAHLYDPRPFAEAMAAELADPPPFGYLARGHYGPQVERYIRLFGRERVLVFGYPELKASPESVVRRIAEAAGLDASLFPDRLREVRANVRAYGEPVDTAMEERLRAYYAPHLRRLDEVLGGHLDLREER